MTEEKKLGPFDFINDLSFGKNYLLNFETEKAYNSYIINLAFSNFPDTVRHANEMNRYWGLDNKMQHDFYFYGLSSKKRWSKWGKKQKDNNNDITAIRSFYGNHINNFEATKILNLLEKTNQNELLARIRKIKTNTD